MALEYQNVLSLPESPFAQKLPDYQQDPGFLRFQATHFAPGGETYPEYLVWWWLVYKAKAVEFEDFQMYVRIAEGAFIPDCIISTPLVTKRTWLEVYGEAFHSRPVRRGPETLAFDKIRREFALANGFEFIRLSDVDVVNRLDYTMRNALAGREIRQFAA